MLLGHLRFLSAWVWLSRESRSDKPHRMTFQRRYLLNAPCAISCPCQKVRAIFVCLKLFYTGPVVNAEMLVVMLEKHSITATQEFVDPGPDDGDLNRPANVFVPEEDFERAHNLFYAERQDEL